MKKIISLLLCLSFTFSLSSCDKIIPDKFKETEVQEKIPTIEVSSDGYLIIDGVKTEYKFIDNKEESNDTISRYYQELELYTKYLEDKILYEQKKAEYNAYLIASGNYEQDLIKYEKYLTELDNYQKIKDSNNKKEAEYNAAVEKYNAYLTNLALAKEQLANLEVALFRKVTYLERELYACLFSPLIDEVIARKDELVAVKPKLESHINNAKTAAVTIQQIFRPDDGTWFDNLKTYEEKYNFYVMNYEAICDNILLLAESLYYIYTTAGIRQLMHTAPEILGRPDYTEKLVIFIAQLFCLHDALVDTDSPNKYADAKGNKYTTSEMQFSYWNQAGTEIKNASIATIFEGEAYVQDNNNAAPIDDISREVAKPVEPQYDELPSIPEAVAEPTQPTKVENPGEPPEAVKKPVFPEVISGD